MELEQTVPVWRDWYAAFAQNRLLVRYDSRGTGLSGSTEAEFDLEGQIIWMPNGRANAGQVDFV